MNMLTRQYTSIVKTIASIILLMMFSSAQAGEVTYDDDTYSTGDTLTASDLNTKFNSIKSAINDNNANSASKQTRVTGTCAIGSSIREIASDGSVVCETPSVSSNGADSPLKIIRGSIDSGGNISTGGGFTLENTGTGVYKITYNTTFSPRATVVANTWTINGYVRATSSAPDFVTLNVFDSAGTLTNAGFHFIAIGN